MNIITQDQLKNLTGGMAIDGIVLIKDYSVQLTRNGKEYIAGRLQSGTDKPFKAWGSSAAFNSLKNEAYENVPTYIRGSGDEYGGTISLILDSVQAVDGYTPDQFFPVKYNADAYWEALKKLVSTRVSAKAMDICNKILFENQTVSDRFKVEFAGRSHHDNCKSGLLAHTYKVTSTVASVIQQYPAITSRDGVTEQNLVDLLLVGALLHDVGKIYELEFGVYQPASCVTHKYLGSELIAEYKAEIIAAYDELWYYYLISIMLEHHGQYGEPPKTVWAQIIHIVDMFDSQLTDMMQAIDSTNGQGAIKFDTNYLSL